MEINVVTRRLEINATPFYTIFMNNTKTEIEFDDVDEKLWKISFQTLVAIKITAIDFCDVKKLLSPKAFEGDLYHRYILEVDDSLD